MNKKETDILLIRKYLNGELDAKAMHRLERRAQSDPFLMDALEGYGHSGKDQRKALDDISNRLEQRVNRKEARIIPWKFMAAAASVLIVLTIGGLQLFNKHPDQKKVIAANVIKPVATPEDTIRHQANFNKRNDIAALRAAPQVKRPEKSAAPVVKSDMEVNDVPADKLVVADKNNRNVAYASPRITTKSKDTTIAEKDTTPLNEVVVMNYATQKKKDVTGASSLFKTKDSTTTPSQSIDKALQSRVDGVTVTNDTSITGAHPQPGWGSFDNYLKTRAISPDGKTGYVKLSFKVDPKGVVSDIRVIKGLSKATNQKAIELINNGPLWVGSLNELTRKIVVKITFAK